MTTAARPESPPFKNAYWVEPGLLLAGPYPGDVSTEQAEAKIRALADSGIGVVINLQPADEVNREGASFPDLKSRLADLGIDCIRLPIRDMDVPAKADMSKVLDAIDHANALGKTVYVHCWGGHGRTGTVVGCWLRRHGLDGQQGALARMKEIRAAADIHAESPQTPAQRNLVSTWPSPDMIPASNRLAGAVWGALVADALGVPYEFGPSCSVNDVKWGAVGTHGQPPGTWSDDGGLLLALLDSLVHVGFDTQDQGRRSVAWLDGADYKPGKLFDVGGTTRRALVRIRNGAVPEEAGGMSETDNGNGSLMRILPIGLVGAANVADLVEHAERSSSVTHGHPRARLVCALYCLTVERLLAGELDRKAALLSAIGELRACRETEFAADLDLILSFSEPRGSGYVVDTFWSAWTAFETARSYEECVRRAVAYGGDTDTTACVAGGLAGIYWGVSGIPGIWLVDMRGRGIVQPLVSELLTTRAAAH